MYDDAPAGYSGNEDCGQMSAWYIFSAMGFYPVNPANGIYAIGSPILKTASIALHGGKKFTMIANNVSPENIYIQSAKLNGKNYNATYLTHNNIVNGGSIEFTMGPEPNKKWGVDNPPLN